MFDFINVNDYTPYFNYAVLLLLVFALIQCFSGIVLQRDTVRMNAGWGVAVTVILILYMGLRPVSSVFGDTIAYADGFRRLAISEDPFHWTFSGEWVFNNSMRWFAKASDIHGFFLCCATIYVGSLWLAMVRMFRSYYYIPFLVIICMFTFWAYGVNGVRNGMGASLFILAMTYVENLPVAAVLSLLAVGCHQSVWLMVGAAALAYFYKNSYYYLAGWLLCVVVSFFVGDTIQSYIAGMEMFEDNSRFTDYLTVTNIDTNEIQMEIGFRWDFLLYSAIPVILGWYFIFRKAFVNEYYHWIYNVYLVTNSIWVLVIRASYSNRLAQISWFIMPIVLIYPLMKKRFWENHEQMLGYAMVAFYAFTFYYNIIKG